MHPAPPTNGAVQLREVYTLVQSLRTEVMSELKAIDARWDQRLSSHESTHERDAIRRSSLIRWAVTSIMTGVGVLISLWYSMR